MSSFPSVSVIIPTSGRAEALARTLDSLARIDFPKTDAEVLVVENGVRTGAEQRVERMRERHPRLTTWRHLHEPIPGLLAGRHRGARESHGEVLVFVDDDVRFARDWLQGILSVFAADPEVAVVGGPSRPLYESTPPEWLGEFFHEGEHGRECGYLSLFDGGSHAKAIDPCQVWGLNYAIRRELLFGVGGFNPDNMPSSLQRFQGDGETGLSLKLRASGRSAMYCPAAAIEHEVPASRLRPEYFEARAFYQGVCDSYTTIRQSRRAPAPDPEWKRVLRDARDAVRARFTQVTGATSVQRRVRHAYRRGFLFHQREVTRDGALLAWVLQQDYWNYNLPKGWERYWSAPERN